MLDLRRCIEEHTPNRPDMFSEPESVFCLPFPSLHQIPRRFEMLDSNLFTFNGREVFATIWQKWLEISDENYCYRAAISIYGSTGYGKSHILAALVCLLIHSGERVIYIPDCEEASRQALDYLQTAFLFAFFDSPSDAGRILAWKTAEDVKKFRDFGGRRLCFVIDQRDALDPLDEVFDFENKDRGDFDRLLTTIAVGHKEINGASANACSYKYGRLKQTNDLKIDMLGGMTKV